MIPSSFPPLSAQSRRNIMKRHCNAMIFVIDVACPWCTHTKIRFQLFVIVPTISIMSIVLTPLLWNISPFTDSKREKRTML